MGFMDTIKNTVQAGSQSTSAMDAVFQLINQGGGIQGLIQNFQQQGMGHIMQSWIGRGQNLPIEPHQLRSIVGESNLTQMSQKTGLQSDDLLQKLAHYLPLMIDKLTPDGQVQPEKFSGSSILSIGKMLFH